MGQMFTEYETTASSNIYFFINYLFYLFTFLLEIQYIRRQELSLTKACTNSKYVVAQHQCDVNPLRNSSK